MKSGAGKGCPGQGKAGQGRARQGRSDERREVGALLIRSTTSIRSKCRVRGSVPFCHSLPFLFLWIFTFFKTLFWPSWTDSDWSTAMPSFSFARSCHVCSTTLQVHTVSIYVSHGPLSPPFGCCVFWRSRSKPVNDFSCYNLYHTCCCDIAVKEKIASPSIRSAQTLQHEHAPP